MITGSVRRLVAVGVVVAAGAVWAMPGTAQQARRGGPTDWSHARIMASRFGPDADQNIGKNWRTVRKHMLLDAARGSRDPYQDWLEQWFPQLAKPAKPQADAPHLDWNLKTGGYGNVVGSPAKYNFDLAANNCSDVIYFTVDQPGGAAAVNVIAITNPYAGCTGNAAGTTPTVKFGIALPFGTATSAVPSLDGTVLYVIRVAPLGQRRHDSPRDQREQHHFHSRRLQLRDHHVDVGAHARELADRHADQRADVRVHVCRGHQQRGLALP